MTKRERLIWSIGASLGGGFYLSLEALAHHDTFDVVLGLLLFALGAWGYFYSRRHDS